MGLLFAGYFSSQSPRSARRVVGGPVCRRRVHNVAETETDFFVS